MRCFLWSAVLLLCAGAYACAQVSFPCYWAIMNPRCTVITLLGAADCYFKTDLLGCNKGTWNADCPFCLVSGLFYDSPTLGVVRVGGAEQVPLDCACNTFFSTSSKRHYGALQLGVYRFIGTLYISDCDSPAPHKQGDYPVDFAITVEPTM